MTIFPKEFQLMSLVQEDQRQKERKSLKEGKMLRGIFGNIRIQLPKNLLEKLQQVSAEGKKRRWPDNSISVLIRDAIIDCLFKIEDNGCLDPEERELKPEDVILNCLKFFKGCMDLSSFTRERIGASLRERYPIELRNLSEKRLNNIISDVFKKLDIKTKKGRPSKKVFF